MEMKLEQFNGTQDVGHYTSIQHGHQENENMYESTSVYDRVDRRHQDVVMKEKKKESSWSRPLLFITVLLCLILILLIIILGIVTVVYATGNNVECTNTATGASSSSNTNEWADRIAQNVYDKLNITEGNQKYLTSLNGLMVLSLKLTAM